MTGTYVHDSTICHTMQCLGFRDYSEYTAMYWWFKGQINPTRSYFLLCTSRYNKNPQKIPISLPYFLEAIQPELLKVVVVSYLYMYYTCKKFERNLRRVNFRVDLTWNYPYNTLYSRKLWRRQICKSVDNQHFMEKIYRQVQHAQHFAEKNFVWVGGQGCV